MVSTRYLPGVGLLCRTKESPEEAPASSNRTAGGLDAAALTRRNTSGTAAKAQNGTRNRQTRTALHCPALHQEPEFRYLRMRLRLPRKRSFLSALLCAANQMLQAGRFTEAIKIYRELVAALPD